MEMLKEKIALKIFRKFQRIHERHRWRRWRSFGKFQIKFRYIKYFYWYIRKKYTKLTKCAILVPISPLERFRKARTWQEQVWIKVRKYCRDRDSSCVKASWSSLARWTNIPNTSDDLEKSPWTFKDKIFRF